MGSGVVRSVFGCMSRTHTVHSTQHTYTDTPSELVHAQQLDKLQQKNSHVVRNTAKKENENENEKKKRK